MEVVPMKKIVLLPLFILGLWLTITAVTPVHAAPIDPFPPIPPTWNMDGLRIERLEYPDDCSPFRFSQRWIIARHAMYSGVP